MTGSHISLFAGVGMTDIAAEAAGFKTVATAEINPFCRSVLKARFPLAHHFEDVRHVLYDNAGVVRPLLVSGGFPCQDVSDAGYKAGLDGERSGLWREMLRVVKEFLPDYVLTENVASLRHRGLHNVLNDLHHAGYDAQWDCIPAAHVGAPHLRDRIWIGAKIRTFGDTHREAGDKIIGRVRRKGEGCGSGVQRLDKLPRAGAMVGGLVFERKSAANLASLKKLSLLPTPTKSDGTGGPGTTPKRAGGKNLRTVINERNGNGRINPAFLEWMMGLPIGWTDPSVPSDALKAVMPWDVAPQQETVPVRSVPNRLDRVQALGNGLVPQVAEIALNDLKEW